MYIFSESRSLLAFDNFKITITRFIQKVSVQLCLNDKDYLFMFILFS